MYRTSLSYILKNLLTAWVIPTGILLLFFLGGILIRKWIKKIKQKKRWPFIAQLTTPLINILYLISLKIFIYSTPIDEKIKLLSGNIIFIITLILFFKVIRKTILTGMEWATSDNPITHTLQRDFLPLIRNVTTIFLFSAGSIIILKHFNYDVMSLITAFGVSSLAVGLAAKDTLSNMISGFIIILDGNIKPGNRIILGNITGDVQIISLRNTHILLTDGNLLIVPNSDLVNTKIINLSMPTQETLCTVQFKTPYATPLEHIKEIARRIYDKNPHISKTRLNTVYLVQIEEGLKIMRLKFWINDYKESSSIITNVNEELCLELKKEGLLIPFTQLGWIPKTPSCDSP